MKSTLLPSLLLGVLLLACATNAFMAVRFFFSTKELEKLQGQTFRSGQIISTFEALLNDSIRYSSQNSNIIPIIRQLESEIKLKTNNAPANVLPTAPAPAQP